MGQITVRGLSVDLPALDPDTELDAVSSLGESAGLISGFEFSGARVPALELKGRGPGHVHRLLATGSRVR